MPEGDLWSSLVTAIDPANIKAMPAVLQSTINLLETELAKARAALKEIQPNVAPIFMVRDDLAVGAVAAYRQNLIGRAPDFYYGTRRLTHKELGLVPVVHEVQVDSEEDALTEDESPCIVTVIPPKRASLADVLSNSLILDHMAPHLSISGLLALASTCRLLRSVVMETPYVFRHLDLSQCRGAQLQDTAAVNSGDSITEDEYYSAPLRSIFANLQHRSLLKDVRTLILDGLSVPADLIADIVLADRFNVNILSIRGCRHLNERKLMQVLQYAVRPTRPQGTPRVKGIYFFTPPSQPQAAVRSRYRDWWSSSCVGQESVPAKASASHHDQPIEPHQQNAWYTPSGKLLKRSIEEGWAQTIQKCRGIIAFDAMLCRGPRHNSSSMSMNQDESQESDRLLGPAIATVALGPKGCEGCHSSPEGPAVWGQSPEEDFPLLAPVPFHSSSIAVARRPALFPGEHRTLNARCTDCLTDRWCHRCNKWFCASCLPNPQHVNLNLTPHQTAMRGPLGNNDSQVRMM
ncbi:uncharacterized protein ACLA_053700 [Aspergillus clavatus NRRL 1]|uniref:F-box domain-containing protein n=1 Tax=Aspergillus clavatus (strain ATCC 1007 / CBS 513.65 / DSM 816 / NCTC 3887 / NRRL 1 / QM 1276 / 107) TaxID=344612 RepID=A1C900_ASPCL|nr:uncharacterized protein ACLA_053700 [Aspergillus clavatus NRRL 1]EAW13324.1 conserved hypothetical protein [Aspergillus clavatus NRRL 1]